MTYEILVDNIDRDEMRSGFLVTTDRKKLWNVQLNLIVEFARICKKHDLKWYASGGTMLGAARHGGFIPWDDDVDLAMMRPEYEKFKKVVTTELKPEFFLDLWYNYVREGEPNPNNFPMITREQLKKYPWLPFSPFLKIRDNRTTYLKYPEIESLIQGIWIDVFPLDPVPPFDTPEQEKIFKRGEELRLAASSLEPSDKTFRERALEYEKYLAEHWFESKYFCGVTFNSLPKDSPNYAPGYAREHYRETTYLPFERIKLPAPIDYDQALRNRYRGDWRVPKRTHSHAKIYSADVSYEEYFARRREAGL